MDKQQIQDIIEEFHVPMHIRKHCMQVARVAQFIAQKIAEQGIKVHTKNVYAAAMLHDLVRICDITNWNPENLVQPVTSEDIQKWDEIRTQYADIHHALAAAEIITKKGYPEIAQIIETHDFLSIISDHPPKTIEQKIVFYADKRVKHDEIVSLAERFADGERRHRKEGDSTGQGAQAKAKIIELEKELMEKAHILATDISSDI